VLGDRRLRPSDLIDDVAADARLLLEQQPHDLDARRMAECLGHGREGVGRVVLL
jgi:hypothetical protein